MQTIIAATKNKGKIREIAAILEPMGYTVISRDEAGVPPEEIEETGTTFAENSMIKARAIMEMTGKATIADDSGLCCDFLNGAPGVFSSRFSEIHIPEEESLLRGESAEAQRGDGTSSARERRMNNDMTTCDAAAGTPENGDSTSTDSCNNAKLARLAAAVPEEERTAHYACVLTLLIPGEAPIVAEGICEGRITPRPRGDNGFGYDPYFIPTGEGIREGDTRTFAEYTAEEKNAVSHRALALAKLEEMVKARGL